MNTASSRIFTIAKCMMLYQKQHDVKGMCITNTKFLYDLAKQVDAQVRAQAVIAIFEDGKVCPGHLVLVLGDGETVVDPSYELYSKKNIIYLDSIKRLQCEDEEFKRRALKMFLEFNSRAEEINDGGDLLDVDYYNKLADYIESLGLIRTRSPNFRDLICFLTGLKAHPSSRS